MVARPAVRLVARSPLVAGSPPLARSVARCLAALVVVAGSIGCGDNVVADPSLTVVGHADLGARGMNSALAVAGDTVYVGSRIDRRGIEIVDISDPHAPAVVGEIPGAKGISTRELRAIPDRDLLIVLELQCSQQLHGCDPVAERDEGLTFYDISDRRAPREIATHPISGTFRNPRSPHEFFVWHDRVFITAPLGPPALEVIDIADAAHPAIVAQWDPVRDGGLVRGAGGDDILHSVAVSPDGNTAYLSHQQGGLVLADISALPAISMITPPDKLLDWSPSASPIGPHSAVKVPDRDLLVVTDEVYPMPYGAGCPWGHMRVVDIATPSMPIIAGEFSIAENAPSFCATKHDTVAFTAHNATVTHDLAFVTWYAGGLQVVDLTDPAHPTGLAQFRPSPLEAVDVEDPALGGEHVEMWSYPVIQDGLIYVVDVRNGLYVLSYAGPYESQVNTLRFAEGNSER